MNVDDILDSKVPTDFSEHDRLDLIFMRQHELMKKYVVIEERNGLLQTKDCPVDIDDRTGQARLKDFFWRVTEELTEAVDAARVHGHIPNHTFEEMADALHFLVEACILSGLNSETFRVTTEASTLFKESEGDKLVMIHRVDWPMFHLKDWEDRTLETYVYEVIHCIGCASNCLKQRPWKQTHQKTDCPKYIGWMIPALSRLIQTFKFLEMTPDQIFAMYWKKSEVNKFRQRSNY